MSCGSIEPSVNPAKSGPPGPTRKQARTASQPPWSDDQGGLFSHIMGGRRAILA